MELAARSAHVGRSTNIAAAGYPHVPTVLDVDVAFGGELVLAGPDPARVKLGVWWPEWAAASRPKLRDVVRIALGDDSGRSATVFAGRVDGVARLRRHAPPSEVARRAPDPTRLYRTSRYNYAPYAPYDRVMLEWWQNGARRLISGTTPGELWKMPTAPRNDGDDYILDGVVELRAPLDPLDVPGGSTIYAAERLTGPRSLSGWEWLVNGQLTPVSAGPLKLPAVIPDDLALVLRDIPTGTAGGDLAELHAPALLAVDQAAGIMPAGEWLTVTASDWLSEAGRIKIGMTPQPAHEPAARWDAVRARVEQLDLHVPIADGWDSDTWRTYADSRLRPDAMSYGAVAARDVDNQPIGDLLRDAITGVGAVPIAVGDGIYPFRARRLPRVLSTAGTVADHPETVKIPAGVVSEAELSVRVTDVVNRVRLGYVDQGDGTTERTLTLSWDRSIAEWGESSTTWDTEQLANPADVTSAYGLGVLVDRIRNAVGAMSNPAYRFSDPVTLTPARLARIPSTTNLLALLDVETRHGMPLTIDHELDDVPRGYTLRAGSIVIESGRVVLTLEPEPGGFSGAAGLVFSAITTALPALTFDQLDPTLTFTDTITIGVPE